MVRSSVAAFYPFPESGFYTFASLGRRDRFFTFRLLLSIDPEMEKIVHRMPEILFATEIAFCGLDRCMAE